MMTKGLSLPKLIYWRFIKNYRMTIRASSGG